MSPVQDGVGGKEHSVMVRLAAAMSIILGIGLAAFSAVSLWPGAAHATMYSANVTMNEAQALSTCNPNPPPAGGGGSAAVMYDDSTNMLSWNITFSNLSGAASLAHFHGPASPGMDAGVQVTISDLASPSVGSFMISEAQESQLLSGQWYINYHTTMCPGGEIRGQVVPAAAVGGVTELTNPVIAPVTATPDSNSNDGIATGLAAAIAGLAFVSAGGALLVGRRLRR